VSKRERERKDIQEKCVCVCLYICVCVFVYMCARERISAVPFPLSLTHTHTHTHLRINTSLFYDLSLPAKISSAEEISFNPQACLKATAMGRLQLAGSLKSLVTFAEYSLFYRALLAKRLIILRSLLIVATPYNSFQSSDVSERNR